ncbi:phosphatase PAP2 family protein [Streptococcus caprae]|uniref:Phosphatase PAP2 family protein n=1 Tax=Streptococcus caprae TaxID=1640501 RepID=A0ABV8CY65_9STRE
MKDYGLFYRKLTKWLRQSPKSVGYLILLNKVITYGLYLLYPLFLLGLIWQGWLKDGMVESLKEVAPYVLIPAISFVLVTIIRRKINQPRPYETWPIKPLIAKNTKGQSMPSRHVFSATIIAMCFFRVSPVFGILALLVAAILGIVRVVGGVHYPKDVAVGYVLGLTFGSVLWFF